jgi:hypothetical protein
MVPKTDGEKDADLNGDPERNPEQQCERSHDGCLISKDSLGKAVL